MIRVSDVCISSGHHSITPVEIWVNRTCSLHGSRGKTGYQRLSRKETRVNKPQMEPGLPVSISVSMPAIQIHPNLHRSRHSPEVLVAGLWNWHPNGASNPENPTGPTVTQEDNRFKKSLGSTRVNPISSITTDNHSEKKKQQWKITLRWETNQLQRMWAINGNISANDRINKPTTQPPNSPVVLSPGPGPDGKLVIKPPEGTWIIINPRLAGLHWYQIRKL